MLHSFTRNYNDLSTDAGFQFEFFCDCCGNGYKSSFIEASTYNQKTQSDTLGRGASVLGNLFGGKLGELGSAIERGVDILNDKLSDQSPQWRKEHEEAFNLAQQEAMRHFGKCPSCNDWVCRDCYNEEEGLCVNCAPRESAYVAKAKSEAMRRNIDEAAETATVWNGKIESRTTVCPSCGKPVGSGKFCQHCGAALAQNKCAKCGCAISNGAKFCPECGTPVSANLKCPSCGTENEQGTKFCKECGTKL